MPKLKLIFYLRKVNEETLFSYFDSLDRFFNKYDKLKEDIEYIQEISEESRTFSARTIAKMFNVIDEIGSLHEVSNDIFLLYFLHKAKFEINYFYEDKINLEKLKKKGWKIVEENSEM